MFTAFLYLKEHQKNIQAWTFHKSEYEEAEIELKVTYHHHSKVAL